MRENPNHCKPVTNAKIIPDYVEKKEVKTMYGQELCAFPFWWMFPLIMVVLCFFMMRGRKGSMMCGFGPRSKFRDSSRDILDKRYARGEIDKEEYEEKNRILNQHN